MPHQCRCLVLVRQKMPLFTSNARFTLQDISHDSETPDTSASSTVFAFRDLDMPFLHQRSLSINAGHYSLMMRALYPDQTEWRLSFSHPVARPEVCLYLHLQRDFKASVTTRSLEPIELCCVLCNEFAPCVEVLKPGALKSASSAYYVGLKSLTSAC